MRDKRDKGIYVVLILMSIVTLVSLTGIGVVAMLYINNRNDLESARIELATKAEENQVEEVISQGMLADDQEIEAMLSQKEIDTTLSMKDKMKELASSKDGGALTMLRYFFPEELVYYDEGSYAFIPIISSLKKHNFNSENFQVNNGEIQYIEDGTVKSHKGIDVSKYQGKIDWEKVKNSGIEYAIIRLGLRGYESGKIVEDENFKTNMRGANDAGVKAGAYFFTQAITVEEAIEEAEYVIENLSDFDVPYPVVFDVEMITGKNGRANDISQELRTDITIAFCEKIKQAGYTPMIYGNIKCFTKMLDISRLEDYEKWYAYYGTNLYFPYDIKMWQYSEKGKVDGIKNEVDINISFKEW